MKKYFFLILFLILVNSVLAVEECQGTMETDDIPCYVLLPTNQSLVSCNSISVAFYNISMNVYNQTMDIYSPFNCNATFNQTNVGTYNFLYSTGDSGSIIVKEGNMISLLLYFALASGIILLILGITKEDQTVTAISAFIFLILGLHIGLSGFSIVNNLLTNAISIGFIGLGAYILIANYLDDMVVFLRRS